MIKKLIQLCASASVCWGAFALGDADLAVGAAGTPIAATADVEVCIIVPEILVFGVGDIRNNIAKIRWTHTVNGGFGIGNNQTYSGPRGTFASTAPFVANTFPTMTNGGPGSGTSGVWARVNAFLFSNNGSDVTITSSTSGGAAGGGTVDALDHSTLPFTIPISRFFVFNFANGNPRIPGLSTGSSSNNVHTNGIVSASATWYLRYASNTRPVAGTYEARVTFTASQP